ncbi:MAG: hypothetical protein ACYSU0_01775 [Planctomycetota bacterium]|jgi:hypothetical protein
MKMARIAGVAWLAFVLVGCGGGYVYDDEDTASEDTAAVVVTPAAVTETPPPKTTVDLTPAKTGTGVWDPKTFLKKIPANPVSGTSDGLARSRDWKVLEWANPAEVSPWKWRSAADDVALIVKLDGGKLDKTALSRKLKLAIADKGKLRMDIYNATMQQLPVAVAVYTSVDRVYFEGKRKMVRPGWNRVTYDLGASDFKCASSEWKHTAAIWGKDDVREIVLLFYGTKAPAAGVKAPPAGQKAATLAIDSIQVDGKVEGGT